MGIGVGVQTMLKAIVFDFDGVLVESIQVKIDAFRDLFAQHPPEAVEEIVQYHIIHGGISRYEKFDHFYNRIIETPLSLKERSDLGERFSELVLDKVVTAPYVKGAREFLEAYHGELNLYVASGTPEGELLHIVEARGMSDFFKGVFGSPARKAKITKQIMTENGYKPEEVVFVGDSITDQEGARGASVRFIGRVAPGDEDPFEEHPDYVATIEDLTNLRKVIETINELFFLTSNI